MSQHRQSLEEIFVHETLRAQALKNALQETLVPTEEQGLEQ